ncbi:two-component system sensor histidine kinase NtrB [Tropicimonas sp.]|uniref:two-component system sensor histidine kinase NtrB n=1 Tax=Tropicimonas sp. TaxID=2067044 RepID=UPI003A867B68
MPGSGRIWSSLPIPAMVLDVDNRITALNPAGELFLNRTIRSIWGEPVLDLLAIDAPMEEVLERVRSGRSPVFVNDTDVGTGDRPPVICNIQIAPISGDPERLLFLVSPREIADRVGRSMSADKAAKSAIGMAEMLAHEIKNPLAGIAGAAQLLSMSLSKDDLELTDLIVAETRRIVKLLDQVEQFGNLSPPVPRPVNIHDVLDRARKSAMIGFAAHMRIVEDYDPSLPATHGDADQLLQVFLNLLRNAAEAARGEAGEIRIHTFYEPSLRVRRKGEKAFRVPLQIEIIDNGPGLPAEIADEIFDPFVSGRENGTGLGLALVSKIISEHKGWISVDSAPGRTVFRISLPVAPQEGDADLNKETR